MVNFFDWLDEELDQRNWVRADLAKRAKISESGLSMAYSGKRGIGPNMLTAIAGALNLPEEDVFRAAGLLPPSRNPDELNSRQKELLRLAADADEHDLDVAIAMLEAAHKLRNAESKSAKTKALARGVS